MAATTTIGGLPAVTSGNLTGAAVMEVEDATSTSAHSTLAQLRTNLLAGGTGFTATDPLVAGLMTSSGVPVAVMETALAHAAGVVINTGVNDARPALVIVDALGPNYLPAGTYRVASNLTLTSAFKPTGGVLKPDSGVTITVSGPFTAGLYKCFDLSAGGFILFSPGAVEAIQPEWFGAGNAQSAAVNTPAIQAAINASLGITSLTQQPTALSAPVALNTAYPITTIYLPRFHELRGRSIRCGFSSTANVPMLVLGRSLAENDWIDSTLYNVALGGTTTNASQIGIQSAMTGASAYIANLDWRSVSVTNAGGAGVQIISDNVAGMIVRMDWDKVKVVNSQSYAVHIKVGVFNVMHCNDGLFSDCGNGFFVEDIGSGTTASEAVKFTSTQFESLGQPLGGSMGTGTFGFKSTMYTGHYDFDGCYFEGNGNKVADTTGANIDVRSPWMLDIHGSVLASSNNQVIMRFGGRAKVEGNFIAPGANRSGIFVFDSPPPGSDLSVFRIGVNEWDTTYTQAQLVTKVNSPTTFAIGYQGPTTNYYEIPPRQKLSILRDREVTTVDAGAIGYNAVKRLANNSGGSTSIADGGIASICTNVVTSMILVTEYNGSRFALFLLASGRAPVLVAQDAAGKYTITKDNATTLNVYNDSVTTNTWVVQNKTGGTALLAVRFFGCEPMEHADDGYYETQFA